MSDETIIGRTRGGERWVPEFVTKLDPTTCIGCGRCYKVCPRDVFELLDRAEVLGAMDGEEFDEDYDDDDDELKVMAIKNALDCIGCKSCSRVCPKNCHTHESFAA